MQRWNGTEAIWGKYVLWRVMSGSFRIFQDYFLKKISGVCLRSCTLTLLYTNSAMCILSFFCFDQIDSSTHRDNTQIDLCSKRVHWYIKHREVGKFALSFLPRLNYRNYVPSIGVHACGCTCMYRVNMNEVMLEVLFGDSFFQLSSYVGDFKRKYGCTSCF